MAVLHCCIASTEELDISVWLVEVGVGVGVGKLVRAWKDWLGTTRRATLGSMVLHNLLKLLEREGDRMIVEKEEKRVLLV